MSRDSDCSRFSNLRGVRWRIDLGILPSSPLATIEELRRVAADSRRRYATLRRRLLVDPHLPKDGTRSPDLTVDNPLSQNPDSTWGRFFKNAELEKTVDQDLSRLYPEHGSYFQTPACQAMLRRILLLWCLRHPEYGYRQGMHELLAPLLYVLHVDLQYLSQIRALNEDCFSDEFDEMSFPDGDPVSNYRFTKSSSWDLDATVKDDNFRSEGIPKVASIDDLDPETRNLFFLSDVYGAEGELGVILSERFIEHDAYCMFDSLMSGARGVVAMADFFSPSPIGSSAGLPPVIEASSALYHLLSIIDSSLHSHLVELGIEPQYFALRWLRVLFGREFSLSDLLLIWDELFSSSNASSVENGTDYVFKVLCSPRGAYVSCMAVSMLLHLRSSLLATENATSCLQRLLNFPNNVDIKKLIEKAKSWQALALETNISSSSSHKVSRVRSLPIGSASPKSPNQSLLDSYWEEKWRVLHEAEAVQKFGGSMSRGRITALLGERFSLLRTESDTKTSSVRRRLLEEFSEASSKSERNEKEPLPLDVGSGKISPEDRLDQNITWRTSDCREDETSVFSMANSTHSMGNDNENGSENSSVTSSSSVADNDIEEPNPMDKVQETGRTSLDQNIIGRTSDCTADESSVFSTANSPHSMGNDHKNELENSSVASNSSVADNDVEEPNPMDVQEQESTLDATVIASEVKQGIGSKDRKVLSGRFQWFLRFGRGAGEGNSNMCPSNVGNIGKEIAGVPQSDSNSCRDSERVEVGDKKVMGTLKNLGLSMLDNIQVIESAFQQERGQASNLLGGKGQATAFVALKELRKISNLLSEM